MLRVTFLLIGVLIIQFKEVSSQVIAPGYSYQQWTIEDGLPINEVSDIEQTRDGYIWLSTYDGLVRFDGNRFVVFNKGNTDGIISNRLQGLYGNRSDELWITTETINGNEYLIHFKENTFKSYGPEEGFEGDIHSIGFYEDGELWVVNQNKVLLYTNGVFEAHFEDQFHGEVFSIHKGMENGMWISTNQGIFHVNPDTTIHYSRENGLISNEENELYIDTRDRLWASNRNGVNFIEYGEVQTVETPMNLPGYTGFEVFEDKSSPGRIIIPLDAHYQLVYVDGSTTVIPPTALNSTGEFISIDLPGEQSNKTNEEWFKADNKLFHKGKVVYENPEFIIQVYDDLNGGLWVAKKDGLYHVKKNLFASFDEENDGIWNVYPLLEDQDGVIWSSNINGRIFKYENETWSQFFREQFNRFFSLLEDSNGRIWAGHRRGISRYDRGSERVFNPIEIPLEGDFRQIRSMHEDDDKTIWFGGINGITRLKNNGEWDTLELTNNGEEIKGVRVIYEGQDKTIWLGTNGSGLFYFQNGELYKFEANDRLSDTIVRSIYEDEEGVLWVGLEGGGLDRLEFNGDEIAITNYGLPEGLFDTVIHIILEDDRGRFWMSSNRGIFWVDKAELNAFAKGEINRINSTFYNEQDGLPGREANGGMQNTGIKTKDGSFWFSMVGGVATINPNDVIRNQTEIPTLVETIIAGDSTFNRVNNEIDVRKDQRDLQFVYTAFNYEVKPENILFRYRLKGYINEWIYAGTRREGFFTNVNAGDYTFEVQASIDGTNWSTQTASLEVNIEPYFRETTVFWVLIIIAGVGLLFVSYRLRTAQLLKRQEELETIVQERTEDLNNEKQEVERQKELVEELSTAKDHFFTNISHELRTPLTLVLGPLQKLVDKKADLKEDWQHHLTLANRNGHRLKQLVEQVLDLARLDSDKLELNLSKVDVRGVTKLLGESFESLVLSKGNQLIVEVPLSPCYAALDADKFHKILTNLISNAIKFTSDKGSITVSLSCDEELVKVSVTDTGKGISKEHLPFVFDRFHSNEERIAGGGNGLGVGLNLTKEFVELHGGSISVTSEPDVETRFEVTLPVGKELLPGLEELSTGELRVEYEQRKSSLVSKQSIALETHILIVEDNKDMSAYIRSLLDTEEVQVSEAENGVEGKKRISLSKPDLIISDVMMPDMDGFEFVEFVRSVPEYRLTPIIMLTALAGMEDRIQALDLGVSDYLTKPFHEDELIARVRNLLRLKKEREEILPTEEPEDSSEAALFVKKLQAYVEERIENSEITVEELSDAANWSRRQLYYKIKSTTGFTPAEFVREIRLTKARQLIEGKRKGTVSEIAYAVGFSTPTYFTRLFIERFGTHPKELLGS